MKTKKPIIVISAIILAIIAVLPFVLAIDMGNPFASIKDLLYDAMSVILDVFSLGFLGTGSERTDNLVAFMRLLIWVISFAVFNVALGAILGGMKASGAQGANRLPGIISFCLATITAIFMPSSVLLAIGIQYSAVWVAIIMGAIFAGIIYVCYKVLKGNSAWIHGLRVLALLFCWGMLSFLTQLMDDANYSATGVSTLVIFQYFRNTLDILIGILLVIEIVRLFGSLFGATVGNAGSHMSRLGGWVNNARAGGNELLDSLKGEEKEEKAEKEKINLRKSEENALKGFTQRKSGALVNLANENVKLETRLEELKQMLLALRDELSNLQKTHNLNSVKKLINDIRGGLKKAINEDNLTLSRSLWVYDRLSKEEGVYQKLGAYKAQFQKIDSRNPEKNKLKQEFNAAVAEYERLLKEFIPKEAVEKQDMYEVTRLLKSVQNTLSKIDADLVQEIKKPTVESLLLAVNKYIGHIDNTIRDVKSVEGFINLIKNQINREKEIETRFTMQERLIEDLTRKLEEITKKTGKAAAGQVKAGQKGGLNSLDPQASKRGGKSKDGLPPEGW